MWSKSADYGRFSKHISDNYLLQQQLTMVRPLYTFRPKDSMCNGAAITGQSTVAIAAGRDSEFILFDVPALNRTTRALRDVAQGVA